MSRLSVSMSGGGPWGFRLYGGGSDPLVVAKLRKRSKASEAGLVEGDVLLSINQYSSQNMSHPVAMAMVDQANESLSFEVLRGTNDPNAVHAAFQTLGSQYQTPPASAPSSTPSSAPAPVVNGYQQQPNIQRHQETFNDGNSTRQVTTETSEEKFGGTTVTKVRRQEVTQSFGAPPAQPQQTSSLPRKPAVWAPSSTSAPGPRKPMNVRAPAGVNVSQNLGDQSITLTLGLGGDTNINKENQAPSFSSRPMGMSSEPRKIGSQHLQRISKVNASRPNAIWTPSFIPDMPDRPAGQAESLMDDMPDFAPEPEPEPEPMAESEAPHPGTGRPLLDISEDEYARMMMDMIMHGPESPNTLYLKKKKVFADSAFYDDPEHKYPTIEEQIKMARKVALSLESPANKKARGHKMFMKRKQKSYRWVAGQHGEPGSFQEFEEEAGEHEAEQPYYHPQPWNVGHTWQPPVKAAAPKPTHYGGEPAPPPPAPSMTNFNWNKPVYKAPTLPMGGSEEEKEEKSKSLSMDEFERMRMFEQKVQHNKVSPAVGFRIAEDLHGLKGKGAKLFAKRKAKSEDWVVKDKFGGGGDSVDSGPSSKIHDPSFVLKLTGGMMPPKEESPPSVPRPSAPAGGGGGPRLQAMINPPKAAMTPWDAMAHYGDVDKAFSHLDDYMKQKKSGNFTKQIASNLKTSIHTGGRPAGPPSGPGVIPEFSRKIQPWDQGSDISSHSSAVPPRASTPPHMSPSFSPSSSISSHRPSLTSSTTSSTFSYTSSSSKLKPWSSTTALNRTSSSGSTAAAGGFGNSPASSKSSSGGGFRPVKFKAPGSGSQGMFDANPILWQNKGAPISASRSPARSPAVADVNEEDGFCDL